MKGRIDFRKKFETSYEVLECSISLLNDRKNKDLRDKYQKRMMEKLSEMIDSNDDIKMAYQSFKTSRESIDNFESDLQAKIDNMRLQKSDKGTVKSVDGFNAKLKTALEFDPKSIKKKE